MMSRSFIFLLLFMYSLSMLGQAKHDYVWIFGSNALALEGSEGSLITFNENGRDTSSMQLSASIGSNNASICDENGRLLFYTNGCAVFDSTFQIMENGDGINPGSGAAQCDIGNYPGVHNSIIIPDNYSVDKYYYLHKTRNWTDDFNILVSGIHLTTISFESEPLGEVLNKNIVIDADRSTLSGFVEVIQHQNGRDWWVIDFTKGPAEHFYLAYLIDEDSITLQHEVEIENIASLDLWCSSTSQSCFSPDGTKLAKMCPESGFDLWDFDRSNGQISNYRHLPIETNYVTCGVGISPNSRFAYLSCIDSLWQIDLWEDDLSLGLELIDTLEKGAEPGTTTNFGYQQLGPDCKIYMNTIRQYDWLHVINKPDEKGKDCDFRQHNIKLPHLNQPGSFPNFPHFRIDEEDVCDPTITSVFGVPVEPSTDIKIYPNPVQDVLTIELQAETSGNIYLKSNLGKIVDSQTFSNANAVILELGSCIPGIYYIDVVDSSGKRYIEKVVKSE